MYFAGEICGLVCAAVLEGVVLGDLDLDLLRLGGGGGGRKRAIAYSRRDAGWDDCWCVLGLDGIGHAVERFDVVLTLPAFCIYTDVVSACCLILSTGFLVMLSSELSASSLLAFSCEGEN